jgi:hypothetical protein
VPADSHAACSLDGCAGLNADGMCPNGYGVTCQSAAAWRGCDDCQTYWRDNANAVIFAAASVGIERGLTTNAAIDFYFRERHAEHA